MSAALNDLRGGAVAIDKPAGMTSHDVVNILRKLYGTRKVGHTGTLDPMATGVLVVLVGRAVKASDLVMSEEKAYVACMRLGFTSDTEDASGNVVPTGAPIPERSRVIEAAAAFLGDIMQVPPMYSALKVGGQKLVDLARRGIDVERQARKVTVYSISADGDGDEYTLCVSCSKGTYIRTLISDIGKKLGCGAIMMSLRRTKAGGFDISEAHSPDEIKQMSEEARMAALCPCERLFSDMPRVNLPPFYERLFLSGCQIYQKKIGTDIPEGTLLRVYGREFIGIGEVKVYPEGTAVKVKAFL